MKLLQEVSPVETGGAISEPTAFKIAASKEAFRILSSGLYNNKILAIIRELSCNAYDAHVAAGKKDEPFEIHLPTTFEPTFSIKDNGVGLSHDEVLSLYTTYFGTNKSESNDYVGALGLGSKSPFCYTEGFTVTSCYQGKTRIYSCFIDSNGMPAVQLQEENETPDIPNGLEVMFPVDQDDVYEFENQARTALEFFNPKPILNSHINIDEQKYILKTEKWGLRKNSYTKHGSGLRAIQGMVQYTVGTIDESRLTEDQENVVDLPLDLFFDIGDLAVAASREMLSNDEHTIGNILKALSTVKTSLLDNIKNELKKCKTLWEARLKIFSLVNTAGIGRITNEALNKGELDGIYEGFIFSHERPTINQLDYKSVNLYAVYARYGSVVKTRLGVELEKYPSSSRESCTIRFDAEKGSVFVINDVGFGVDRYVRRYLRKSEYRTAYLITRKNKDILPTQVKNEGKLIIEKLGGPPFILVSEIKAKYQDDEISITPTQQSPVRKVLWFNTDRNIKHHKEGYTIQGWTLGWEDATNMLLPPGPKYYVRVKRLEPQTGNFHHAEEFKKFILAVKNSGLFGISESELIYGIPLGNALPKGKQWVEFTSYVFDQLPTIVDASRELALSIYLKPFRSHIDVVLKKIMRENLLSPISPMQLFCDYLSTAKQGSEKAISNLSVVINKATEDKIFQVKTVVDFNKLWEKVLDEYPLIRHLDHIYYESGDEIDKYIDYIKLIDSVRPVYSNNQEESNESPICIEK